MPTSSKTWPYPLWIAHRGAGKLAPENTLAAFHIGASHGYRMFECDVKLSADGIPFLLHDNTLQRTTNSQEHFAPKASAVAGDHAWSTLSQLDAGSWHSQAFSGEPLPSLENIARYCLLNHYFLNIEIKPTPGLEYETGQVVANHAALLWQHAAVPPLLTAFDTPALEASRNAQPQLPRGLLLDSLKPDWIESALTLDCVAIVCHHTLWDSSSITQAKNAGFRTLSYTVNNEGTAQRLINLGLDCIITDRVELLPAQHEATKNPLSGEEGGFLNIQTLLKE